ncbi:thiamine diphosphokinase [Clostridium polynesiense]|uniref:thiamine diphosphokinase n=1 Tax=Clostridium polynesiense TaxID=1325933 RepID=UPI00058BC376|nr:thiamine diphosphokinase [Clostridium polynesiense]
MKILIIGGGKLPEKETLIKEYGESDYVICADKGGEYLFNAGLNPTILIGDLDSISQEALTAFKQNEVKIEKFPAEKDYTDTELCVYKALEQNPDEIIMLGCTGSRVDHLLGNLGLLKLCLDRNVKAVIKDENNEIFLIDKPLFLKGEQGKLISLQAYSSEVSNINLKGVKYPLKGYNLKPWSPFTVSNVINDSEVEITFTEGILMVILPKD